MIGGYFFEFRTSLLSPAFSRIAKKTSLRTESAGCSFLFLVGAQFLKFVLAQNSFWGTSKVKESVELNHIKRHIDLFDL